MEDDRRTSFGASSNSIGALSDRNRGELEVLNAARNPKFGSLAPVDVGNEPGPPPNSEAGVDLHDVLYALLQMTLRRDASFRTAVVTVTSVQNAETYTVTINSVDHDYLSDADATEAEILAGLRSAILIGIQPVVSTIVGTTLVIVGNPSLNPGGDYTIAVSATGAATLGLSADATSVSVRVHGKLKGASSSADPWHDADDNVLTVDHNTITRLDVSGIVSGYPEITSTDGRVVVGLAPCVLTEQEGIVWPA